MTMTNATRNGRGAFPTRPVYRNLQPHPLESVALEMRPYLSGVGLSSL